MNRVICVGNRRVEGDSVGPRVYDALAAAPAPEGVEFVDGGTAGLNLLPLVEGCRRVVFVDAAEGFGPPGEPVVLSPGELEGLPCGTPYHGVDLAGLLRVLPAACDGPPPEVLVVGVAPPAPEDAVRRAASLCLALARGEEVRP